MLYTFDSLRRKDGVAFYENVSIALRGPVKIINTRIRDTFRYWLPSLVPFFFFLRQASSLPSSNYSSRLFTILHFAAFVCF